MRIEFKKNRMTKEQENEIKVITLLSGFAMEILMKERPFEEINYTYSKKIIEALSQHDVSNRRELLIAFADAINIFDGDKEKIGKLVDLYLKSN